MQMQKEKRKVSSLVSIVFAISERDVLYYLTLLKLMNIGLYLLLSLVHLSCDKKWKKKTCDISCNSEFLLVLISLRHICS